MDATSPIGTAAAPLPIAPHSAQRAARAYGAPRVTALPMQTQQKMPSNVQRLVAAVVPGSVDFSGSVPAAAPGALPFYRNPADKNAAAVAIDAGRSLDVTG